MDLARVVDELIKVNCVLTKESFPSPTVLVTHGKEQMSSDGLPHGASQVGGGAATAGRAHNCPGILSLCRAKPLICERMTTDIVGFRMMWKIHHN